MTNLNCCFICRYNGICHFHIDGRRICSEECRKEYIQQKSHFCANCGKHSAYWKIENSPCGGSGGINFCSDACLRVYQANEPIIRVKRADYSRGAYGDLFYGGIELLTPITLDIGAIQNALNIYFSKELEKFREPKIEETTRT